MSYVKISISKKSATNVVPAGKTFGYLLHDYDIYGLSRPSVKGASLKTLGLPETVKVLYPKFMDMTREWQLYWVDLFSLSLYGVLYSVLTIDQKKVIGTAFSSVTKGYRAFTNKFGWDDGYADYINNLNIDNEPMKQETINTGGNVVEVLSDKLRLGGKDVYKVLTLDGNQSPPNPLEVNHITHPELVFKATISRRENYNQTTGKWGREDMVIPFDQLQSKDVPIPFMNDGTENYIEAERIKLLLEGEEIPSSYRK